MHDGDLAAAIAQIAHEVTQRFEIAPSELRHAAVHFPPRGAHHSAAHFDRDRHAHRARIAATHSATRMGSSIRQAPKAH